MINTTITAAPEKEEFSLVLGGPLYQLLLRARLIQPSMGLVHRRILVCLLVTFLPLIILTALAGTFSSGVRVPFFYDLANLRFLIMLPILIGAEIIIHRRIRSIVNQFLERGLIVPEEQPRFKMMIESSMKLRDSVVVELMLLLLSFTGGYWVWSTYGVLNVDTWYAIPDENSVSLTWAGYWFAFVSLPVARFIVMRWYFRLFIWYLFLWRVSRLHLQLNPLHPDRAGGLGFLSTSIQAFAPVMIAQSCFLAAMIGNLIINQDAKLPDFKIVIVVCIVFFLLLILFPLVFFIFQMLEAKLAATRKYGTLASRYVGEFQQKWLDERKTPEESLLGSSDIQSLADLGNSFEVVRTMRLLPFDKRAALGLITFLIIPLLPLALTMFSFQEIAQRLIKLLI